MHTLCTPQQRTSWAVAGLALGMATVAFAQDPPLLPPGSEGSEVHVLTELLRGGGLPAVLAALAWWARGALGSGVPVLLQLHEEDRALLRRWTARQDEADDARE